MAEVTLSTGQTVETGCYVDGHWGQYGPARAIEVATDLGWDDQEAADLAARHMASMGPSDAEGLGDDDWESLNGQGGAADDAETYLNGITPDGYAWGWSDGEFFLWADHDWASDDPSADPCACPECVAERLSNLPGAPLHWDGMTYDGRAWETSPAPTGGDSVPMGTLGMAEAGPPDEVHAYQFPYTVWGDYAGSTCERSNWRVMLEDYRDHVIDVFGGYGSHYIAVPTSLASSNPSAWEELAEIARGLADYPVINDEDISLLENEIAAEAWDRYLWADMRRDFDERGVSADMLDHFDVSDIRENFYRLTYAQPYGPEAESADSVVFPFYGPVVDELAEMMRTRLAEVGDEVARLGGPISLVRPTDPNQGSLPA